MSETSARKKANDRWKNKHRQLQNYYVDKSKTKKFILKESTYQDLLKASKWIYSRKIQLKK